MRSGGSAPRIVAADAKTVDDGWTHTPPLVASGIAITEAVDVAEIKLVAALFRDYATSLPVSLDYQDFASEVAGLPGSYASPRGRLLLARGPTGAGVGCVALRSLTDPSECEIKRLYIDPLSRGGGVGRALVVAALTAARVIGYGCVRLDTLPSMVEAHRLYDSCGFAETTPYYAPTPAGTVFMALRLSATEKRKGT